MLLTFRDVADDYLNNPLYLSQNLQADYTMDSHAKDLENYANVARCRRRRAKALMDFERHDDDELGFRKNDIITVHMEFLLLK